MSNPSEGMKSKAYLIRGVVVVGCTIHCVQKFLGGLESMRASYFKEILKEILYFTSTTQKQTLRQTRIQSRNASGVGF